MSTVTFIDPDLDPRWDQFVESHSGGLICHLSGWKQVIERSFSHIKGVFPVVTDATTGAIAAGMPLYLVSSPLTGKRLVSIPFATLSHPLAGCETETEQLLAAAIDLAGSLRAQRIEIRCHGSIHLPPHSGYERVDFFKHHFLPLHEPLEGVLKRFHRTSVRPLVKRCEENGLELHAGNSYEDLQSFYRLYVGTRKRLGLPPQPFRLFEHLWHVFAPSRRLALVQAYYGRIPTGALLVFKFKDRVSAEFMGVDEEFRHLHVSHFLFWQAIKLAHHDGFIFFDFGRTSPNNPSLIDFKRRWGTVAGDLPQLWFPRNSSSFVGDTEKTFKYRAMRRLVRQMPKSFLPLLGKLCYRHMG